MRHPECFKAASHGIQPGRLMGDPLLPFESTPTTTARQREEPVTACGRTHGKRHQADVRLGRWRGPERQLHEVLLT